jgi:hypothetical protein
MQILMLVLGSSCIELRKSTQRSDALLAVMPGPFLDCRVWPRM